MKIMNEILYKDEKYELYIIEHEIFITIYGDKYKMSYNDNTRNTHLTSEDGTINIIKPEWFCPFDIEEDLEVEEEIILEEYELFPALEFCKMIEDEILKEKAKIKQKNVKETGCKTSKK